MFITWQNTILDFLSFSLITVFLGYKSLLNTFLYLKMAPVVNTP